MGGRLFFFGHIQRGRFDINGIIQTSEQIHLLDVEVAQITN